MNGRMLIAGVGNIFLGDDGFGVEVVRRLAGEQFPDGVTVADFGIRGIHLAYELVEGYDTLVLIDAVPRGGEPGTVYVIEPEELEDGGAAPDAHSMDPGTVFAYLRSLGGGPTRALIVGCEPARTEEEIGLSEPVAAAVDEAIRVVRSIVAREQLGPGSELRDGASAVGAVGDPARSA